MFEYRYIELNREEKLGKSLNAEQQKFDIVIEEEIKKAKLLMEENPKDSYIYRASSDFVDSVSWTDTDRDTTFTTNPTAIVIEYEQRYLGHLYVWIDSQLDLEVHVISIRKSMDSVKFPSTFKISPLLFDQVEFWALQKNIKTVRVQDPLPGMHKTLFEKGYVLTERWHDLSVKTPKALCEKSDMIKYFS